MSAPPPARTSYVTAESNHQNESYLETDFDCPLVATPASRGPRIAVMVIGVTSLLASLLVFAVAAHVTKSALEELSEEVILLVVLVAAMACVIASLLIHGRRIVFWLFFGGFISSAFAQAGDDPFLTAAAIVFFVGPLSWNTYILLRLIGREDTKSGIHKIPKH